MKRAAVILTIMIAAVLSLKEVSSSNITIKGIASWYSQDDPEILMTTANMEVFDDTSMTCAIWDLPFNTLVKVTNVRNGRYVVVRVNDRGPARRLNRVIDLTKAAFSKIADLDQGLTEVSVEIM